jgi:hypothetical protein
VLPSLESHFSGVGRASAVSTLESDFPKISGNKFCIEEATQPS